MFKCTSRDYGKGIPEKKGVQIDEPSYMYMYIFQCCSGSTTGNGHSMKSQSGLVCIQFLFKGLKTAHRLHEYPF